MTGVEIATLVIGIILLVLAVALIALVLMQQGKDKKLSGAITGGTDTFFSKGKSQTKEKKLSKYTTILAVAFCILDLVAVIVITVLA